MFLSYCVTPRQKVIRIRNLKLPLGHSDQALIELIIKRLRISYSDLLSYKLVKRSIDARSKEAIKIIYSVDVSVSDCQSVLNKIHSDETISKTPDSLYINKVRASIKFPGKEEYRPVVVGAGPCGYFAALSLAQMGFQPLLIEQGKSVKERTREIFDFWKLKRSFHSFSNVQFGEGGAGTFSDGKLYSRISDPKGYSRKVLEELVESGANPEILTSYRPHIGTFKLATVVRGLRSRIENLGGEIRFQTRMDNIHLKRNFDQKECRKQLEVEGIKLADGSSIRTNFLILALGHSARDSFSMLQENGVDLEQKLFSVGFRIEHSQFSIDHARWGSSAGHPQLGHAEYNLVHHASNGRTVYTFCMCPGGLVVGSTSEEGCVVTNGMSQHSRNERNANAALVVDLEQEDFIPFERFKGDPLAGIYFQRSLERKAFKMGGGKYFAPVQRLDDFLSNRASTSLGNIKPSYLPGVNLSNLNDALPSKLIISIREALPKFEKKLSAYCKPDTLLTGIETRTSSPVRISRDTFMESTNTKGLYPAGEGAGYAGGILSAAVDGIKVAEFIAKEINKNYF